MSITDRDRKLLWGRSGNRCAICRKELIEDATPQDDEAIVGRECHIISGKLKGPRHDPNFPADEIDDYPNLILLCGDDHTIVDHQDSTYTADMLRQLKRAHEIWVAQVLRVASSSNAPVESYSMIAAFEKVKSQMPELIAEMKAGLTADGQEMIREFFVAGKHWQINSSEPRLVYYHEDHGNIQGMMHILENYGFIVDVTHGNTKIYRMTEAFVELVLSS